MPKTALHQAAAAGHVPAVAQLIANGSQVTCWDKDGWTPLHHACRNDHADVAAHLIAEGADVNAKNKRKVSPLHESAYRGFVSLVELLIDAGAAINATDKDGWTPLHAACRQGNLGVVRLLLKANASLLCRSRAGKLPRDYAVDQRCEEIIALLDANGTDTKGDVSPHQSTPGNSGVTVEAQTMVCSQGFGETQPQQSVVTARPGATAVPSQAHTSGAASSIARAQGQASFAATRHSPLEDSNAFSMHPHTFADEINVASTALPLQRTDLEPDFPHAASRLNPGANTFMPLGRVQNGIPADVPSVSAHGSTTPSSPLGGLMPSSSGDPFMSANEQKPPSGWFDKAPGPTTAGSRLGVWVSTSPDTQTRTDTEAWTKPSSNAFGSPPFTSAVGHAGNTQEAKQRDSFPWDMWSTEPTVISDGPKPPPNSASAVTAFGSLSLGTVGSPMSPLSSSSSSPAAGQAWMPSFDRRGGSGGGGGGGPGGRGPGGRGRGRARGRRVGGEGARQ